jgi:PmbA protein
VNALDVAEAALRASGGDAEATVATESSGLARFASSEVHQPTLIENVVVTLRVIRDGRVGVAVSNRIEEDGLRELARRAEEAAASAPADPSFPGLAEPAEPPAVEGYDAETAALTPEDQARLAAAAIRAGGDHDVYGFCTSGVTELAVASSAGVGVAQKMTDVVALVIAAREGESGYAERSAWRVADLDPGAVAREAAERCARTRGAVGIEPAPYRAVLERYALADLLLYFGLDSFGAVGLLEGRSYLSGRLGQRVFDEKVTISDDALDPRTFPKAFDFEGCPKERVALVESGVARDVVWDRVTAAQAGEGHRSTGHAPPPLLRGQGPFPTALSMAGGDAESVDELAERVGDGIYVTRLHYLSVVDSHEGVITGMTRDGTFRIRDGKIAEPLVNLRFTVSVPELLADVPGLTREPLLVNANDFYGERYPMGTLCPAIATARFNITGVGSKPGI